MLANNDPVVRAGLGLNFRLPNSPPLFMGRESETEALVAALHRCPVAVLSGPAGVGKTALALHGIRRVPGFTSERALLIRLRPGPTFEAVWLQLIRALAGAHGVERADWSGCLQDEESVAATVIDLADSSGLWIVLDELQHMDPGAAASLLGLIARYARQSRWVVTSCAPPQVAELQPQMIPLGGLSDDVMARLAAALVPNLPAAERQQAALAAGGSPYRLLQLFAATEDGAAQERLLGGLPEAVLEFVRTMAAVGKAVPLPSLPSSEFLPVLVQRGLILHGPGGYMLHDTVRRFLRHAAGGGLPTQVDNFVDSASWEADAALDGARQHLGTGKTAEVVTMLDTWGERLLSSGSAAQLWALLEPHPDRRLAGWRLRCAVALAQPDLLAQLDPPVHSGPEEQLLWARGLLIQGQVEAAIDLASDLHAARHGERMTVEAGLLVVECMSSCRRYREAAALLDTLEPTGADLLALHESWSIYCMAATDQVQDLGRRLHALQGAMNDVSAQVRGEVGLNLAKTLSLLGRTREAYAMTLECAAYTPLTAKHLSVQFALTMELGLLEEAAQLLRKLESFRSEGSPRHHVEAVHRALYQLCVGDLRACDETISYWKPELARLGDHGRLRALSKIETRTRLLRAEAPPSPCTNSAPMDEGLPSRWNELFSLHWRVRAGELLPAGFDGQPVSSPRHHHLLADIIRVDALLVQGNARAALQLCVRVLVEIEELGWGMMSAELRHTHCDILLVLGRWSELELATRSLHRRASEMPSPRLLGEAQFFTAFAAPRPVDWGLLEVLATHIDTAPIAARRARVLLGGEGALDAIDRLVLAALREHRGIVPSTTLSSWAPHKSPEPRTREEPGWSLADDECRVWLPSGTSFSLAERPQLWCLLVALHERGGTATKEQLVQALWNEAEYHPLHHDNRLQVAVRKLRKLIEDDPSRPSRLVTTADGYILVGRVRRVQGLGDPDGRGTPAEPQRSRSSGPALTPTREAPVRAGKAAARPSQSVPLSSR